MPILPNIDITDTEKFIAYSLSLSSKVRGVMIDQCPRDGLWQSILYRNFHTVLLNMDYADVGFPTNMRFYGCDNYRSIDSYEYPVGLLKIDYGVDNSGISCAQKDLIVVGIVTKPGSVYSSFVTDRSNKSITFDCERKTITITVPHSFCLMNRGTAWTSEDGKVYGIGSDSIKGNDEEWDSIFIDEDLLLRDDKVVGRLIDDKIIWSNESTWHKVQ